MLDAGNRLEDGQHFLAAQDHAQPFRKFRTGQVGDDFRASQCGPVEEFQRRQISLLQIGIGLLLLNELDSHEKLLHWDLAKPGPVPLPVLLSLHHHRGSLAVPAADGRAPVA